MENSIRHSIDIKSEDFAVIIALQNLQTFIMIGYTAVEKVHLGFDFSYLWALCIGTLLFVYSLISFVIIRTFVFSKIDIGKYVLELLFTTSIIATCSLSMIIDSFKIPNMQLLFFSFALTGYAYYNLITLIFFSVTVGILIQYSLSIGKITSNSTSLFFIDLLSYALQVIGGNILYFRMYNLCYIISLSKKNPCKYVVASKEVKRLEKQIFASLLNSYMCFKSKTYSNLAYTNDLLNKDNSNVYSDMKSNSLIPFTKSNINHNISQYDNNNFNKNINSNSYFKKLKISSTKSIMYNSSYNKKSFSLTKGFTYKKLYSNNSKKDISKNYSKCIDHSEKTNVLEQNSTKLRKPKKESKIHNINKIHEKKKKLENEEKLKNKEKRQTIKKSDKSKKKKSGLLINSKSSLFITEEKHKKEMFNDDNSKDNKSEQDNNIYKSIVIVKNSSTDEYIKKENNISMEKNKSSDFIIDISNNKNCFHNNKNDTQEECIKKKSVNSNKKKKKKKKIIWMVSMLYVIHIILIKIGIKGIMYT